MRLDKITPPLIHGYRERRLGKGTSARTVNLDTIALRNALKFARDRGLIERLPETRQLRQKPSPKRSLFTKEEFGHLLAAATEETTKNSVLFRLYLRFLALTGAREKEALAVRWADVDFERETVTIGSGGVAKNHKSRAVDFSPELGALLLQMQVSRPPNSSWLFPSPQRGSKNIPAQTLRESLLRVRKKAGLHKIGFHDLRHFLLVNASWLDWTL